MSYLEAMLRASPSASGILHRVLLWHNETFQEGHLVKGDGVFRPTKIGFLPDNIAYCHRHLTSKFSVQNNMLSLLYLSYLLDLAPMNFHPSPKGKNAVQRSPFQHCCRDPAWFAEDLYSFAGNNFQAGSQKWQERRDRFIFEPGEYFEGNSVETWIKRKSYFLYCICCFGKSYIISYLDKLEM